MTVGYGEKKGDLFRHACSIAKSVLQVPLIGCSLGDTV